MKKIGFVTPWYGEEISGGAEMEAREVAKHLKNAGMQVEILTTCVKDFNSDWNVNHYEETEYVENEIKVRRFAVEARDTEVFNFVNRKILKGRRLTEQEKEIFIKGMVYSPGLFSYIREHQEEFERFVYIPYMFGTTYFGISACPQKSVLIPCFHRENYFFLDLYQEMTEKVSGIVYNARAEYELANAYYRLSDIEQIVMGIGMDTQISGDGQRFCKKYKIKDPFILYAGRKDVGKNVDELIKCFMLYKRRNSSPLKLVMIGGGKIGIPREVGKEILDLGFVDIQDKYDAYAAADIFCQPSRHESFSLVIMESWLMGTPVLVSGKCPVTRNFTVDSNGGLYYETYPEFEQCVKYLLKNKDISRQMGENGRAYVRENFEWDRIVEKYQEFFEKLG